MWCYFARYGIQSIAEASSFLRYALRTTYQSQAMMENNPKLHLGSGSQNHVQMTYSVVAMDATSQNFSAALAVFKGMEVGDSVMSTLGVVILQPELKGPRGLQDFIRFKMAVGSKPIASKDALISHDFNRAVGSNHVRIMKPNQMFSQQLVSLLVDQHHIIPCFEVSQFIVVCSSKCT